jgi:hypothetical protein
MGGQMKRKLSCAETVLLLGLVGIFSVFVTIISDLILLGRPDTAYSFFELGTESMAGIAQWRITTGTFIGVFMLPFQIAGLISIYHGLKSSGKLLPALVVLADAHALIMGVAFHASYAFIASGWKLFYTTGPENLNMSEIMQKFDFYWKLIIVIMLAELIFSSTIFVLLVMSGKTMYPKWMALLNPLCVILAMFLVIPPIPAPVGGYVGPTTLNMATLIFFIISTIVIYKRLKRQEAEVRLQV